jgi:hypothetical protein
MDIGLILIIAGVVVLIIALALRFTRAPSPAGDKKHPRKSSVPKE